MATTFKDTVIENKKSFEKNTVENKTSFEKKQKEGFNQANEDDSFNPTIKNEDLTVGESYKLDQIKHVKTKFGLKTVAIIELLDTDSDEIRLCDLFLPIRFKKVEDGKYKENWIKYHGVVEEGKSKYKKHLYTLEDNDGSEDIKKSQI